MYQKWVGMGRLVRDPELRYSGDIPYCKFTMACDKRMSKEAKERAQKNGKKTAEFINVTAFRKPAELVSEYFQKGDPIMVEGTLSIGSYEDDSGIRRKTADIILDQLIFPANGRKNGDSAGRKETDDIPFDEDDIPF